MFERWSWFKFNNLRLALSITLKFYRSMEKGLKLNVREFWVQIPTFRKVRREKLVGDLFAPPILNRHKFHMGLLHFFYKDEIEFPVNKMVYEYHKD